VGGGVFDLAVEGQNVSGLISMPQTNGWQTWQTLRRSRRPPPPHAADGDTGGYYNTVGNFNWFSFD
jgi:hypothetical protein